MRSMFLKKAILRNSAKLPPSSLKRLAASRPKASSVAKACEAKASWKLRCLPAPRDASYMLHGSSHHIYICRLDIIYP